MWRDCLLGVLQKWRTTADQTHEYVSAGGDLELGARHLRQLDACSYGRWQCPKLPLSGSRGGDPPVPHRNRVQSDGTGSAKSADLHVHGNVDDVVVVVATKRPST